MRRSINTSRIRRVAGGLAALAIVVGGMAAAPPAAATVVFDNFDSGGGFHREFNLVAAAVYKNYAMPATTTRAAARFSVVGGDFSLTSVTLPISVQNNVAGNFLRVRVTEDAGGVPGTTLEVLSESQSWPQFSSPFGDASTLLSAAHPLLLDGHAYWIVTEPTSIPIGDFVSVDYRWFYNTSGTTVPVRQQTQSGLPSDPWPASFSGPSNVAFRVEGTLRAPASPPGPVVAWGINDSGQTNVPSALSSDVAIAVAGGSDHGVALLADGTVAVWGGNAQGQLDVPSGLANVKAISSIYRHTLALRTDGTVVAWGDNYDGQSSVPAGLAGVKAIAAGGSFSVALLEDGTVVTWGGSSEGEMDGNGLTGVKAISAGAFHGLALMNDGTVRGWGGTYYYTQELTVPPELTNPATAHVVAVSANGYQSLALRSDGTLVAWGRNDAGEGAVPPELASEVFTAISAGAGWNLALRGDGTLVAWGSNFWNLSTVPVGLHGVTALGAGWSENLVIGYLPEALNVSKAGAGTGRVYSLPTGIDCGTTCSADFQWRASVGLVAEPLGGSTFHGWSGACTGTGVCSVLMDGMDRSNPKAVVATFSPSPTFALTVTKAGSGAGSVASTPPGIACGATCTGGFDSGALVALNAAPAVGSAFTGWSGACTGTGPCSVTMDAAQSVTATFVPTFMLTLNLGGDGKGTVDGVTWRACTATGCTADVSSGAKVTLTGAPDGSSIFKGWGIVCTGNGPCTFTMNAAKTVLATFNQANYTLTVGTAGKGVGAVTSTNVNNAQISCATGSPAGCAASFPNGASVTLTASWDANTHMFKGWSGGVCKGTAPTCTTTMTSAKGVMATFDPKTYPLTVTPTGSGQGTVNGPGISCNSGSPSGCIADEPNGPAVTLTAIPPLDGSSVFKGWAGCSSVSGTTCTVYMTFARYVEARFEPATFPLTLSFSGAGTGTVTGITWKSCGASACTGDVANGATVTLKQSPAIGSTFRGWGIVCTGTGDCVFTMNAAKTVLATFDSSGTSSAMKWDAASWDQTMWQ